MLIVLVLLSFQVKAQYTPIVDSIVMTDGKKLVADIYLSDTTGGITYPTILIQTPYNRILYRYYFPLGLNPNNMPYNVVIVDWRCFYGSWQACIANPDRGKDGYDVVEWIASQSWSNGKVGTWGASALGKIQFQTAKEQPPHLVCAAPMVAGPQFDYSEYYQGGVYRTEYIEQLDALGYGLSTFIKAHPTHDYTWQYVENANNYPQDINIPMLIIGGWYDHNTDLLIDAYNQLISSSGIGVRNQHRLLIGPWRHSGVGALQQGELTYPQAQNWSDSLVKVFFNYYLRDVNNGWLLSPKIQYFLMGDNLWKQADNLNFSDVSLRKLYLKSSGNFDGNLPVSSTDYNSFDYDPHNPSPTYGGATLRADLLQGPYNQATNVESRPDVLIYSSPNLSSDVVMKGKSNVRLFVSSDRYDTDFTIRVTDVYPDDRSILLTEGIKRMRFRNGFTDADTSLMVPGNIYQANIDLPFICHTFKIGHKIRIDISSSNFPRFDRNLNNGGKMYVVGDTLIANNKVFMNSANASYIEMPINNLPFGINENTSENIDAYIANNPIEDIAKLIINSINDDVYNIKVYDIQGKVVYSQSNIYCKQGIEQIQLDMSSFNQGCYLLNLSNDNNIKSLKLIITK